MSCNSHARTCSQALRRLTYPCSLPPLPSCALLAYRAEQLLHLRQCLSSVACLSEHHPPRPPRHCRPRQRLLLLLFCLQCDGEHRASNTKSARSITGKIQDRASALFSSPLPFFSAPAAAAEPEVAAAAAAEMHTETCQQTAHAQVGAAEA